MLTFGPTVPLARFRNHATKCWRWCPWIPVYQSNYGISNLESWIRQVENDTFGILWFVLSVYKAKLIFYRIRPWDSSPFGEYILIFSKHMEKWKGWFWRIVSWLFFLQENKTVWIFGEHVWFLGQKREQKRNYVLGSQYVEHLRKEIRCCYKRTLYILLLTGR